MRCGRQGISALALTGVLALSALAPARAEEPAPGKQLYATKTCIACHGKEGRKAIQDYPDIAGQRADYAAAQIKAILDGSRTGSPDPTGTPRTKGMRGALIDPDGNRRITDQEIDAIAAWLAGNKPRDYVPPATPMADDRKAEATKLYAEACEACHGKNGREPMEGFPAIGGQKQAYLLAQIKDIKSKARTNGQSEAMQGAIAELADDKIALLAEYLAQINPAAP